MSETMRPQYFSDPKRQVATAFAFAVTNGGQKMPGDVYELADILLSFDKTTWEMVDRFIKSFEEYRAASITPVLIPNDAFKREIEAIKTVEVASGH